MLADLGVPGALSASSENLSLLHPNTLTQGMHPRYARQVVA